MCVSDFLLSPPESWPPLARHSDDSHVSATPDPFTWHTILAHRPGVSSPWQQPLPDSFTFETATNPIVFKNSALFPAIPRTAHSKRDPRKIC